MTAPTLPGSIPGLLRRGSPVVTACEIRSSMSRPIEAGAPFVVTADIRADGHCVAQISRLHDGYRPAHIIKVENVALDLSDATGRAHAAWFVVGKTSVETLRACGLSLLEWEGIRDSALHGFNLSLASIDALRRVCLHVAGVTP